MWCPYCGHDLWDDMPHNPKPDRATAFYCPNCGNRCQIRWVYISNPHVGNRAAKKPPSPESTGHRSAVPPPGNRKTRT